MYNVVTQFKNDLRHNVLNLNPITFNLSDFTLQTGQFFNLLSAKNRLILL